MSKTIPLFILFFLLAGCAGNYYVSEKKELNDSEKRDRYKELERVIAQIKAGDAITILLYNGDIRTGNFYSYIDGVLSIRVDDSFRDNELSEIRSISFKPQDRLKKVMIIMMFVIIAGIIAQFAASH